MTYNLKIEIDNEKLRDFIAIIRSLKNVGVINSYESIGSLGLEGEPLTDDELLSVLEISKKEVEMGKSFTSEEVREIVKGWKKRK